MEAFIDKGYPAAVLAVLNNVRIHMQVVVLSDMSNLNGTRIANWALRSEVKNNNKWKRPPGALPRYRTRKSDKTVSEVHL